MTAPDAVTDPELQEVAWDLSDLLDGAGDDDPQAAVDALLAEAQAPRRRVRRRATPARSPSSTAPGLVARDARARRDRGARRPRRHLRAPVASRSTPPTRRAARCCSASQEKGTAIETALLFFELEWAALDDDARRGAARHRRARLRPPPPAHGAPLPPAPADRARGADPHREGADRPLRVGAAVRGADVGDHASSCPTATSRCRSRSRSRGCSSPDREVRRDAAERVTAALAARPAHARLRVQHAARRQDGRRPAARLPALAGRAATSSNEASDESVQALVEAVRGALRDAAPLVPAEGAAARHRPARRLRPHGAGHRRTTSRSRGRRPSELVLDAYASFSRRARRRSSSRFFDERWIDAPVRPGQARRRVLRLHRAERAPVRDAQLHLPAPRRADARARARPRRARGARRRAGRLPHGDAADAGRDRVGVRRDARVRAPARRSADTPESRLSLLAETIEGSIATVFRQVAMNRFEHLVHTARRERGRAVGRPLRRAVGASRRSELLGDAVEVTEGYRSWWSYVPHFIAHARLRLRVRLRAAARAGGLRPLRGGGRRRSCPPTSSCCAAGGSRSPEELGADRRRRPRRPGLLGPRAWTSSSASSTRPRPPRARPAASDPRRCSTSLRGRDSARLFVSSMVGAHARRGDRARARAAHEGADRLLRGGGRWRPARARWPGAVCAPVLGRLVDRRGQPACWSPAAHRRARSGMVAFAAAAAGRLAGGDPAVRARVRARRCRRSAPCLRTLWPDAAGRPGARARRVRARVGGARDHLHRRAGADRGRDRRVVDGGVGASPARCCWSAGRSSFAATPPSRGVAAVRRPAPARGGALRAPGVRTLIVVFALIGRDVRRGRGRPSRPRPPRPGARTPPACCSASGASARFVGGLLAAARGAHPPTASRRLCLLLGALAVRPRRCWPCRSGLFALGRLLLLVAGTAIAPSFGLAYGLVDARRRRRARSPRRTRG